MKTKRWLALVVVAVGVLYGVLTGADAAGLINSPAVSDAFAARRKPETRLPASIEIEPDRVTLNCVGVGAQDDDGAFGVQQFATITVRVRDSRGKAVPDGTIVKFTSNDGSMRHEQAPTRKGEASSFFTPFGFTPKPVIDIVTGELEASITLRCSAPQPCGPMSPPQPFSPPCETPPGCTPAFSPPQAFSPPCGTPTPVSPPPVDCDPTSPPQSMSPPCGSATPTPCTPIHSPQQPGVPRCGAPAPLALGIDCDVAAVGLQSSCVLPPNARMFDAGVVLSNVGANEIRVTLFQFNMESNGGGTLRPRDGIDANRDGNPDLDEANAGDGWTCAPPSPDSDTGENPSGSASFISCYLGAGQALTIASAETVRLAVVHFDVSAPADSLAELRIVDGIVGTSEGEQYGPCDSRLACGSAGVTTAAQGVLYYALDCDTATAGVQDDCTLPAGTEMRDVAVVAINDESTPLYSCGPTPFPGCEDGVPAIDAFQFYVHDPDTSFLEPPAGGADPRDSNPDFNEAVFAGNWDCGTLAPDNDTGADGPGKAVSRLACFNGIGGGAVPAPVPEGSAIVLGVVRYDVHSEGGGVTLTLDNVVSGDRSSRDLGNCEGLGGALTPCLPATIRFAGGGIVPIESPIATSTPTPSTPTPAALPLRRRR